MSASSLDIISLRGMLRESLADGRMTREERDRLVQALACGGDGAMGRLRQVRAAAWEVAREAKDNHPAEQIITWLEEVARALEAALPPATTCRCLFAPHDPCVDEICAFLGDAKTTIDLCIFTITDDRIVNAIESAHRRGVRVRLLTDDEKSMDAGSDISRLARLGIPVRHDNDPAHMHHKFAIVDDTMLLTGSYNWTRSAADDNDENILILDHPGACRAFSNEFDRLWLAYANR